MTSAFRAMLVASVLSLLASCSYRYAVEVEPPDAALYVDGTPVAAGAVFESKEKSVSVRAEAVGHVPHEGRLDAAGPFGMARLAVVLEPIRYPVTVATVAPGSTLSVDGGAALDLPAALELAHGSHVLELRAPDRPPQAVAIVIDGPRDFLFRHLPSLPEAPGLVLEQLGVARTGRQPKSVVFSPDSRLFVVNLLDDGGFQVFDAATLAELDFVKPEGFAASKGFVEGIFVEGSFVAEPGEYWVSQMTTGTVFRRDVAELGTGTPGTVDAYPTGGSWSKVIAYSPALDLVAVSNWLSNDVTLLERETGAPAGRIGPVPVPRGLAFSPDGELLYVTSYDAGLFLKYRVADGKELARIALPGANMRHVVLAPDAGTAWVSDMGLNAVYEVELAAFRVVSTLKTSINPNTIDLTPDGGWLFASTRGPNNPESYLLRSLKPGKLEVFDLATKTRVISMEGGTQPTGLDVSPDGTLLAFTNFQDDTVELYRIAMK
ncbi:MAG: beta-propeller fold lactonase family protein [Spirochaetales bacterium]|nr:beta-propeller fold lactonase family protein [Spirochaetales bacterium]